MAYIGFPPEHLLRVSVIIPYFQRKSGLLSVALTSIFTQSSADDVIFDVIVVDDASPVGPHEDLRGLDCGWQEHVRVIKQANAGPAAARNTALNAVAPDADLIAFLDSDDHWLPNHIAIAKDAIRGGASLFFADNWADRNARWFSAHPIIERKIREHSTKGSLLHFDGTALTQLLIEEPLIHLSTLVIDARKLRHVRFVEQLMTGEDHLYTLQLADQAASAVLSCEPTMRRGDNGVNFYRATLDWNSPKSAWRALTTVEKYFAISDAIAHRPMIAKIARQKAQVSMEETVYLVVRNVARFPFETLEVVKSALALWGVRCSYAVLVGIKVLWRRSRGPVNFRV